MTKEELIQAQERLDEWRESHKNIDELRKAFREKIPDWVVKSMAFEGEPVSLKRLGEYLKSLKNKGA